MTARVCFQVIVWNGMPFLEAALKSIIPYAPVVAVEGAVRYYRERGYENGSDDGTKEILHDLLPGNMIVHGAFEEKDEMCNAAVPLIPKGTTHIFCVDSDEIFPPSLIEKVLRDLDELDSMEFKPHTFYGGFDRTLTGFELRAKWQRVQRWHEGALWLSHRPPTILAPDGRPYHEHRHAAYLAERFFHYSYVMPKQVKAKIEYYASWNAGVIPGYMERVYLPWVKGDLLQKAHVECEFNGVHEWLPRRRGDCFTTEFTGKHPNVIAKQLPELRAQFDRELAEVMA